MQMMRNAAKRILNKAGFDLRRIDTPMRSLQRGISMLSRYVTPASVLDIGVARGTPELYSAFPATKSAYLLVEANPNFKTEVERLAVSLSAQHRMVFCGEKEGTVDFTVYRNQGLSSAYLAARSLEQLERLTIPTVPLDLLVQETGMKPPYLLKIDVEGAELDVLKGALRTLSQTEAVIIETSIGKRRVGAAEFGDVVCFMREQGFSVFDLLSGSNWKGRLSLVDAVFVRKDAPFREYGS